VAAALLSYVACKLYVAYKLRRESCDSASLLSVLVQSKDAHFRAPVCYLLALIPSK
jgi:hypothetical protein